MTDMRQQWWRSRLVAYGVMFLVVAGVTLALSLRGDRAGADAYAYWFWTRAWLAGGDPYQLSASAMPYVYAPWALPLFVPWAVLPWGPALAIWRLATVAAMTASVAWAARRALRTTALALALLSIPIGINLDTGNLTLPITLALFWALARPRRPAGAIWGLATGIKWITLPLFFLLDRSSRRPALAVLAVTILASLALWPETVRQVQAALGVSRPFRWDYLVLLWAALPVLLAHDLPRRARRWLADSHAGTLRERISLPPG